MSQSIVDKRAVKDTRLRLPIADRLVTIKDTPRNRDVRKVTDEIGHLRTLQAACIATDAMKGEGGGRYAYLEGGGMPWQQSFQFPCFIL